MAVKKAVVLAAGLGTRLRPLTCAVPKPLLPVWGVPILARTVGMLRGWGVDDIVVNCHYLHEQVEKWCAENGCRASYEPEILGTGGVLNPLRDWIGSDDFYLVNADVLADGIDRCPFRDSDFKAKTPGVEIVATALVTEDGPRTIECEMGESLVTCWKSPDPGWDGTWTYCGIARLRPAVLDYVEPKGFSTIVQAYEKAMMDGRFVKAVKVPDMSWSDAGTVESYIDLNRTDDENAFAEIPQVKAALDGAVKDVEFIGARGSDRCFFRAGDEIIVVYDDARRGENAKYASHARWLAGKGIPVPKIVRDLPEMKTLVMEDAGSEDLRSRVSRKGVSRLVEYAPVVEALAKFAALDASSLDLEPAFGPDLWKWERDLFAEHCLGSRYARPMPDDVASELERVAERLEGEPKALVHRDFQSTNILLRGDRCSFIDFQGMRLGPAAYDLASLLYDPYVDIDDKTREALVALYAKKSGRPEIAAVLPFAAVQRLVQALGAYGRLASVGHPEFGVHVEKALENLLAAADEAGLDAIGAMAEDLIAEERRMREHLHGHEGDES